MPVSIFVFLFKLALRQYHCVCTLRIQRRQSVNRRSSYSKMSYLLAVRSLGMMTLMQVLADHASLAFTEVQKDQPVLPAAGDMNCIVGSPFDPNADSKQTSVEYWYGVETTVNDTSNFKYPVESKIYNVSWSVSLYIEET